jgi:PAS domain S-box-containing protein
MRDQDKTKEQLIEELVQFRGRMAVLEDGDGERKRSESALRDSEKRHRAIFEQAPLGIALHDSQTGQFIRVNPRYCEITGRREEEMLSMRFQSITHPDDMQACLANVASLIEGNARLCSWEKRYLRPDGSIVWVSLTVMPMWDAGERPRFHLTMAEDVTERKRAEEALKRAHDELERRIEERTAELAKTNEQLAVFRKFAEASGQAFGMSYLDCKISYANPAMLRLCGEHKSEDVLGRSFLSYYPGQLREKLETEMFSGLEREGKWAGELTFLTAAGISKTVIASAFPILDDVGDPIYLAFVMTDITELKQAQQSLERERRTLEHMLQASDHERQLIAYDIHDGLAQQLAGAIMQFQVYDQLKDTKLDEAKKAYDGGVTLLRQGHSEVRRLISGVRPPILDESGVVAAIAHMVHEPVLDQELKIVFHSAVTFNRLAPVVENVIYRIVQEGLSNARNHSKSKKVVVSLTQRGERLRIEIRDWGIGFVPNTVPESHFGLDGIRERTRLLGGRCNIKSKPGEGTAVVVELPVVEQRHEG